MMSMFANSLFDLKVTCIGPQVQNYLKGPDKISSGIYITLCHEKIMTIDNWQMHFPSEHFNV